MPAYDWKPPARFWETPSEWIPAIVGLIVGIGLLVAAVVMYLV